MEISHWTRCNAIAAARKLLELWSCPQERADGEALKWLDGAPIEARNLRYKDANGYGAGVARTV